MTDAEKITALREFMEDYIQYDEDIAAQHDVNLDAGRSRWAILYRQAKEVLRKTE